MFPGNKIFGGSVRHVISLSGGKDLLAVWLFARERNLDATVVFADTGHEHPLIYEYIKNSVLLFAFAPISASELWISVIIFRTSGP